MSHALRNSLILAAFLVVMWASGLGYLYYWMDQSAEEKLDEIVQMESELEEYELIAARYEEVHASHDDALQRLESFPKQYISVDEVDRLYDLIRQYNRGNTYTELNYSLDYSSGEQADSEEQTQTAEITLEGKGRYDRLAGFIQTIEMEPALISINSVRIDPISDTDGLGYVRFHLKLEAFVAEETLDLQNDYRLASTQIHSWEGGNPFFPLIHEPPPNTENLPDIREARVSGMASDRVWLRLQNGTTKTMRLGDEVYLGRLTSINSEEGQVVFTLNKGGIVDNYILEL